MTKTRHALLCLAIQGAADLPSAQRADLLDEAATLCENDLTLATSCRDAAKALREAESAQLTLKALLAA